MISHVSISKRGAAQGVSTVVDQFEHQLFKDAGHRVYRNSKIQIKNTSANTTKRPGKLTQFLKKPLPYLFYMFLTSVFIILKNKKQIQQAKIVIFHDIFSLILYSFFKRNNQKICLYNHSDSSPVITMLKMSPHPFWPLLINLIDFFFKKTKINSIYSLSQIAQDKIKRLYTQPSCKFKIVKNFIISERPQERIINIDSPNIWMIGTICKRKRQIQFIQELSQLKINIKHQIKLLGPCSSEDLEEIINFPFVKYLGVASNIKDHIKFGDILISVSSDEGLPMSMIEASSLGAIIISTDVGGCKNICIHEYNGFLIPSNFSANDILDKLLSIINNPDIHYLYSKNSLDLFIKEYSEKTGLDFWNNELFN